MSQTWTQVGQEITTSVPMPTSTYNLYSNSYISLSNDGTIMAVGSYNSQGSVQVYQYNDNMWKPYGNEIVDTSAGENGWSVSLSGDGNIVAIGSPSTNYSTTFGSVQVYQYDENMDVWQPYGNKIVSPSGKYESAGYSVSLSNDGTIIAVSYNDYINKIGSTQVYHYSPVTNGWNPMGAEFFNNVTDYSSGQTLGQTVALSSDGTIVAIGLPFFPSTFKTVENGGGSAGLVQVYKLYTVTNTDDTVTYEWKQLGSNIIDASGSIYYAAHFGYSISLSSDGLTIAIGSPGADVGYADLTGGDNGLVQVFHYSNDNGWAKLGSNIITLDTQSGGEVTGYSVSLSGDGKIVAVGSPGYHVISDGSSSLTNGIVQVYQYYYDTTTRIGTWTQISQNIYGSVGSISETTGSAVSLSSNGTVVAFNSPCSNKVYVYQMSTYDMVASMKNGTRLLRRNNDSKEEYVPMKHLKKGDIIRTWKHGWRKITGFNNHGEFDLRDFPNNKKHRRAFLIRRHKLCNKY